MKTKKLILNSNKFNILKSIVTIFIIICTFTFDLYSQPTINSNGPLELGQSVVTSYQDNQPSYNVVRVIDIRNRPPFISGGSRQMPNQFAGVEWTNAKLGNVYGIALDENPNPNIFVSRSTVYCSNDQILRSDSSIIYRLDGGNFGVSTYIYGRNIPGPPQVNVNWMPNTGPGLGNLCFEKWHQQIFVTNHEDGRIYRIRDNAGVGQVKSWFDPFFANNDSSAGYAPKGERLWGIGAYGTNTNNVKVYFAIWRFDVCAVNTPNEYNEIWSIALDVNGEFIPSSVKREIKLPLLLRYISPPNYSDSTFSNPVSDIEFSFNGDMLCGERSMCGNTGICRADGTRAHRSRILEYPRDINGNYSNYIWHKVGMTYISGGSVYPFKNNSSGGVDFEYGISDSLNNENSLCDSIIVGTGDFLFDNNGTTGIVYGLQETQRSSAGAVNVEDFSHFVDITGFLGTMDKNMTGDVDVYHKDLCGVTDTNCITLVSDTTYCDSSGTYYYEFKVHNNSPTKTIEQLEITVDSPGLPNYVVTVPSTLNVTVPPSGTSATQKVKMIGPGAVARTEVCFTLSAHFVNDDCPWCCYITNCIKLPDCGSCVQVLHDSLYCTNNTYQYNFTLQNGTLYNITKIQLTSPGVNPVTFIPQIIHFGSPILPGQVMPNQTVQLLGAVAGMNIPVRIKLFSDDFECCYIELPYTVPLCDSATLININSNEINLNEYSLEQNYPNPFNPNTYIRFNVPKESNVEISIFDVSGKLVKNLVNNVKYAPGYYSVNFDGNDIPSGMYFYRIKANDFIATRKMLLLK